MEDEYQQAAVAHGEGPALVLAGPGSGKTRVIVERAVRLIDEELARPEQLLVLTFSRKAAADLRERLADRLRRSYASFPVTTFHAFSLAILARDADEPPRLARPSERRAAIGAALAAEGHLGLRPSKGLTDEALRFAELCDDYLHTPDVRLAAVRERYLAALGAALDYGGLQREAIALLERDDEIRRSYQDALPLHPRRRVPGHERRPGPPPRAGRRRAQERLLRRRRGPVDLRLPRRGDRQHAPLRGALAGRTPVRPAAQLPLGRRRSSSSRRASSAATSTRTSASRSRRPTERPARLVGRTFRHAAEEVDWIAREIAGLRLDGIPLGEVAVLARSLREVGPRLAYAFRRHRPAVPRAARAAAPPDRRRPAVAARARHRLPLGADARRPGAPHARLAAVRRPTRSSCGASAASRARSTARSATQATSTASSRRSAIVKRQQLAGQRDLRALGPAPPLQDAARQGRNPRAGRGARRRHRPLGRRERVRRRSGRLRSAPSAPASSTRRSGSPRTRSLPMRSRSSPSTRRRASSGTPSSCATSSRAASPRSPARSTRSSTATTSHAARSTRPHAPGARSRRSGASSTSPSPARASGSS